MKGWEGRALQPVHHVQGAAPALAAPRAHAVAVQLVAAGGPVPRCVPGRWVLRGEPRAQTPSQSAPRALAAGLPKPFRLLLTAAGAAWPGVAGAGLARAAEPSPEGGGCAAQGREGGRQRLPGSSSAWLEWKRSCKLRERCFRKHCAMFRQPDLILSDNVTKPRLGGNPQPRSSSPGPAPKLSW